ncbi:MAG: histidine kinase N-terminal domain-containing protein [Acidimicrobiia bacterium]
MTATSLRGEALGHVQRLAASWQPLADLCFSDLLLLAPLEGDPSRFVIVAQVRPTTGQTVYPTDLVDSIIDEGALPLVARAWSEGEIVEGDALLLGSIERAHVQYIPVRSGDDVVAVVVRETRLTLGRRIGELEHHYMSLFDRFAHMIAEGSFPFRQDDDEFEDAPRVGDGVIVLDPDLRVRFASPNAVSSMHRMGLHSYASGVQLIDVGFDQHAAEVAIRARAPVTEEIEHGDTSLLVRAIPFLDGDEIAGVVVLARDVTDLRRRDRMLLSKDATIREIHHRVKNNLQTIAALLRLQGRRLESGEARAALEESERRIRAIAIVHETLSRGVADVVRFDDILQPLVRVVQETVSTPDTDLRFEVVGDAGFLPGDVATPLAVVLNELMQNAADHAFPPVDGYSERRIGNVSVRVARDDGILEVDVVDDGVGLPPDFTIERSSGLGLSIVQALVTTELGGSIELSGEHGTRVHLTIPLQPP